MGNAPAYTGPPAGPTSRGPPAYSKSGKPLKPVRPPPPRVYQPMAPAQAYYRPAVPLSGPPHQPNPFNPSFPAPAGTYSPVTMYPTYTSAPGPAAPFSAPLAAPAPLPATTYSYYNVPPSFPAQMQAPTYVASGPAQAPLPFAQASPTYVAPPNYIMAPAYPPNFGPAPFANQAFAAPAAPTASFLPAQPMPQPQPQPQPHLAYAPTYSAAYTMPPAQAPAQSPAPTVAAHAADERVYSASVANPQHGQHGEATSIPGAPVALNTQSQAALAGAPIVGYLQNPVYPPQTFAPPMPGQGGFPGAPAFGYGAVPTH